MDKNRIQEYIAAIKAETAPATGCTEPAAVALCAAAAAHVLNGVPDKVTVTVSEYIFKNAMNVGIPGVNATGLEMAVALGIICAEPEKKLQVLSDLSEEEKGQAHALCKAKKITISIAQDKPKVYIQVLAGQGSHKAEAVIENSHSEFTDIILDEVSLYSKENRTLPETESAAETYTRTLEEIWQFVMLAPPEELAFLEELITLNSSMAQEGLGHPYGLQVGKSLRDSAQNGLIADDIANYAVSVTAAAADARMAGCEKTVMSVGGSGNQGLTATLPLIAIASKMGCSSDVLYKSLALSILVTVHVKRYIGKLSVLCGCSLAAAFGVAAGAVFLLGGNFCQAKRAINTIVADISGVVCDGAKPGCALKIATSVSSAIRAASLAIADLGATGTDGIVHSDVELSLQNLGTLGNEGMQNTNQSILKMVLHKES